MSKGSKRRPLKRSKSEFEDNWDRIFKNPRSRVLRELAERREWRQELDAMEDDHDNTE